MASKLTERELNLLDANKITTIGNKPYEEGKWGSLTNRDFVHFQIFDSSENLIEYTNLPLSSFNVNSNSSLIDFFPSTHIRNLGYESGKFTIRYNFLRKLAGDESAVLVHTLNKPSEDGVGGTLIGDVYTNTQNIYITDDGIIYAGSKEQYISNPSNSEQLSIEDLKYQIDEISPSRTEVRLKAKVINSSYIDDFVNIQTASTLKSVDIPISFLESSYDSNQLVISPDPDQFIFTQQMVGGTIKIPGVYLVDQIDIAVRSDSNVIKNPSGEQITTDNLGNVLNIAGENEWDETLHDDAIRVNDWVDGFLSHDTGEHAGSSHLGYHAKWVQNEGIAGGNAIKFTDSNGLFVPLAEWGSSTAYRKLAINQEISNLQGQGVNRGDFVNVRMDIKSTAANKGVKVALQYPSGIATEEDPTPSYPPNFYDPSNPSPTETQPTDAPDGYEPNTAAAAQAIENQPPSRVDLCIDTYGGEVNEGSINIDQIQVGDDTEVAWGGAGAWIVTARQPLSNDIVWGPNLSGNTMVGTLSNEEQYIWALDVSGAGQWVVSPDYTNTLAAPVGTTDRLGAINYHPSQLPNQGNAYYKRTTHPGENLGWQTTCVIGTNSTSILIKDDLIWEQNHANTDSSLPDLKFYLFDEYFLKIRDVILNEGTDEQKTLYDDIFQYGFIQSVTRVSEGVGNGIKADYFFIFYNNGDKDSNGNLAEESNRWFTTIKTEGPQSKPDHQGVNNIVHFLKNIDGGLNDLVIENEGKMEWFYKISDDIIRYYIHTGEKYYTLNDGDNGGNLYDNPPAGPTDISSGFPGAEGADAIISKAQGYGRYRYIKGDRVLRAKGSAGDGTDQDFSISDEFFRCGELGVDNGDLTYGVRNISADNYGVQNPNNDVIDAGVEPIYDNGTAEFSYPSNPRQIGALSPLELWIWNGSQWNFNQLVPARYAYSETSAIAIPRTSNAWDTVEVSISVPQNWVMEGKWFLYIYGDGASAGNTTQGVVWVDNVFMDFTFTEQSEISEVYRPFSAQIFSVESNGTAVTLNKTFKEQALKVGVEDSDITTPDVYDVSNPSIYPTFSVSYLNFNPKDLRTYLKFGNDLLLTTNFKQDLTNVSNYPHAVVFKLYKALPDNFQTFDECIVVKEMANPLEEKVSIIDFIPEEEPSLVLRSPDMENVESPIKIRKTEYKSQSDILTNDAVISSELRNEFLSQSLDSVEINTDYSQYKNFVNFSSIEKRVRNFKSKLETIEEYRISSASYNGVSGSSSDSKLWHHQIIETKNNLDTFEKYMYFESSSYNSSSLGIFHDNSWPKESGGGTLNSPYVLAHTTSSQAKTWFSNSMTSSSIYDLENNSKLSSILPEFIKFDSSNLEYLTFTDMIGQHFDYIWEYINALTDVFDRRDKLDEGMSKDLLVSVAKSMGWELDDGKDLLDLSRYALGKEVTGSAYSDYSEVSERDISREIWSRIINNMPFFLKNKGTVRALKGLINIYGIPSTILRVKEYGGPALSEDESPQFEITRKFTKALDFRGGQSVKVAWANDTTSERKPDSVEFRFRSANVSDQILVEKQDGNNQHWFIRLKNNGSTDNRGQVSFMLSGSAVGQDVGQYKELLSTEFPVYDGDFYSVMVSRKLGDDDTAVSQSYQLNVGKYDSSRSKIHLYSTSTMDVTQAASSSFSNAWTGSGNVFIGGENAEASVGVQFTGSIMEYRHWTEVLNTGSFKNHVANPKAYDGNTVSSSYENLVLRYSFDDNKDLNADIEGIRDVSSNQNLTLSGSHAGFTGNFFRNVEDELKTHIPSIGALRRTTNKIRIEDNKLKPGFTLNSQTRATDSAYDTAPNDSNKVGIWFAPTDVINNDIINSVGNLNFEDYLGDPRDKEELSYRGLENVADNYWKKYTAPNDFWDYLRMIKYYDQSLYPQLRKLIPARAKPDIGLLIEPNIFERPKILVGKKPTLENRYYTSSINIGKAVDALIVITGSYNHGSSITNYDAYTGRIDMYSYETGSSVVSASGENLTFEASGSEINKRAFELSIWQRLGQGNYITSSITAGDTKYNEVLQPIISGSRIYGRNQKTMNFYTSSADALNKNANSSSFYNVDLDNTYVISPGLLNSYYGGVKNTKRTTSDGRPPVEVIISAPTKLVTVKDGDSTLKTGDGIISGFKDKPDSTLQKGLDNRKAKGSVNKKSKGLRNIKELVQTDMDRVKIKKDRKDVQKVKRGVKKGTKGFGNKKTDTNTNNNNNDEPT